uniref:60S ribosomal protein L29 n=1 Tax=Eutreptiella gymnastica TaxID=73025 RepID=A0A6U8LDA6_9EUGL|mmetsp:Transcript_7630/g.13505  ORF Transcript_7630/g.13505 Transcript_7630/m.13505 type:complete len:124 (+) Transcript_7630:102-473(+)
MTNCGPARGEDERERCLFFFAMAKSKNHTNHNQNYKDHRHGIKVHCKGTLSSKGLEQKLRKNRVKSRLGFWSAKKQKELRDTRAAKVDSYRKKKYEAFKVKLVAWKAREKAERKARWQAKQKK